LPTEKTKGQETCRAQEEPQADLLHEIDQHTDTFRGCRHEPAAAPALHASTSTNYKKRRAARRAQQAPTAPWETRARSNRERITRSEIKQARRAADRLDKKLKETSDRSTRPLPDKNKEYERRHQEVIAALPTSRQADAQEDWHARGRHGSLIMHRLQEAYGEVDLQGQEVEEKK